MAPLGHFLIWWLFGWKGNSFYLTLISPLIALTKQLPHFILASLSLKYRNFENVRVHHRHGYSWMVIGTKPV